MGYYISKGMIFEDSDSDHSFKKCLVELANLQCLKLDTVSINDIESLEESWTIKFKKIVMPQIHGAVLIVKNKNTGESDSYQKFKIYRTHEAMCVYGLTTDDNPHMNHESNYYGYSEYEYLLDVDGSVVKLEFPDCVYMERIAHARLMAGANMA